MDKEQIQMINAQPIYNPIYDNEDKFILLVTGGRASAKSFNIATFLERLSFEAGHKILYTRYTMSSADISIIPEFQEKIDMEETGEFFDITKSDIINTFSDSSILFRGIKTSSGNQTAKLKSIHGLTTFVCDEAEEWTSEKDFETIMYSIRQKGVKNLIVIVMNPTDSNHWVYKRFIENTHRIEVIDGVEVQISTCPNVLHIHTTYLDNKDNLSDEFLKEAEDMKVKNPDKYAHVMIGRWADVAEGAVFKTVHECKEFPVCAEKLGIGLDFGYTQDPSAAVLCGTIGDNLYQKELFYLKGMKSKDLIRELRKYNLPVYSESADPRLIDEIYLGGVNIYPVDKFPGSINAGIDFMQGMNLFVTQDSTNLLGEYHKYTWDMDKNGNFINKPIDAYNHGLDGVRYYCLAKLLGHIRRPQDLSTFNH